MKDDAHDPTRRRAPGKLEATVIRGVHNQLWNTASPSSPIRPDKMAQDLSRFPTPLTLSGTRLHANHIPYSLPPFLAFSNLLSANLGAQRTPDPSVSSHDSSLPLPLLLPRIPLCPGVFLPAAASLATVGTSANRRSPNSLVPHLAVIADTGNHHNRVLWPRAEAGGAKLRAVVEALEGTVATGEEVVKLDAHFFLT